MAVANTLLLQPAGLHNLHLTASDMKDTENNVNLQDNACLMRYLFPAYDASDI